MTPFLADLRLRAAAARRRIAFPESTDARTLEAIVELQREELVDCVVLGDPAVCEHIDRLGGRGDRIELISAVSPLRAQVIEHLLQRRAPRGLGAADAETLADDPVFFAASLAALGIVDGCVAGCARPTADVVRAALWCIGTAPGIKTISSSFYMVVRPFRSDTGEVLTFTDGGVVPEPTSEQLVDIAQAAVEARRSIVGDEPRVAFLSYSTRGSAAGPAVDKVKTAVRIFAEVCPDVVAEGELQADAAIIPDIAARKDPGSTLGGRANVLVFPSLDAGNIAYKLVQRLAGADAIGPILQGVARPCNDLSRGAAAADIVNVACITALQAVSPAQQLPNRVA